MPEIVQDRQVFSLLEVTKSIERTLSERYSSSFWVKAEMNKLNFYKQTGHCYPELVEKRNGKIIAQIKSHLWRDEYNRINNNFLNTLKEPLKDGIKILFRAKISFDPVYGLSLSIIDIDPSYTLGDLEKEKINTINRLREEGIFNKNKSLQLPLLPQRIAIISVETSKGYADFLKVIESNDWNYKFFHFLFPSLLQGDKAVKDIISQLERIKKVKKHFDVVAIIRGGGGDVGLSCYNNYQLANEIAQFPIPVITGIGHATNETVSEMISFYNAITPTKLAEFIIQKFHNFSVPVQKAEETIIDKSRRIINDEKIKFTSEVKLFRSITTHTLLKNKNTLNENVKSLVSQSQFIFKNEYEYHKFAKQKIVSGTKNLCISLNQDLLQNEKHIKKDVQLILKSHRLGIENIEKNINNMSPENVLKRGYSITYLNGKSVSSYKTLKEGDIIETILNEGSIKSTVNKTTKK